MPNQEDREDIKMTQPKDTRAGGESVDTLMLTDRARKHLMEIYTEPDLIKFLTGSNHIEGEGPPDNQEIMTARIFLDVPYLQNLEAYVMATSGKKLRRRSDMNVRVGSHIAPKGGPRIYHLAKEIVDFGKNNRSPEKAYTNHISFETLHPFMDGNGRSGRLLWYYQMNENAPLGFLQHWYYQSLQFSRHNPTQSETSHDRT